MDGQLLKIHEVAKILNCSTSFAYGLISSGRLKSVRLGAGQGGVRGRPEALQEFLRAAEQGGPSMPTPAPSAAAKPQRLTPL